MIAETVKVGLNTTIYHPELSNIQDGVIIGNDCVIHSHVWIGKNVRIGNNVKIQAFTFIPEGVVIDDDVFIGPRVTFTNDPKLAVKGREQWKQTFIKKGAKIGASASILAGVTVGYDSMIGMGAIVLEDVPPLQIWVGCPAKFLKYIQ